MGPANTKKIDAKALLNIPEFGLGEAEYVLKDVLKDDPYTCRLLSINPNLDLIKRDRDNNFLNLLGTFTLYGGVSALSLNYRNPELMNLLLSKGLNWFNEDPLKLLSDINDCATKILNIFGNEPNWIGGQLPPPNQIDLEGACNYPTVQTSLRTPIFYHQRTAWCYIGAG